MADRPNTSSTAVPPRRRRPPSRARRISGVVIKTFVIMVCLGLIAGCAVAVYGYNTTKLPDANADFKTETSFVYYNDGKTQLGSYAVQNRTLLSYDQIPQDIKDAAVAAENRTFWTDKGISIKGILRSIKVIITGGELQGGSTITQQYIKIMYLNSAQTPTRKLKELFLAIKLARNVSKQQILTDYLNTIYFGRGAYGIQAASKAYFNINASKLTVPQAATLAAILNNPSLYDPSEGDNNSSRLLDRYRYVINGMAETGKLSPAEQAKDVKALPKFPEVPSNSRFGGTKGFLLKAVQDELTGIGFSPEQINGGGLRVTTTFDARAQAAAVDAAQTYTDKAAKAAGRSPKNLHAAIASVDVATGGVIAMYGNRDYVKNSRNWAATPRETGSTFKPYAVVAGLENDFSLLSRFNGNTFTPPGDTSTIRNEFSRHYGRVTLLKATTDSINTAFVDLTTKVADGPAKVIAAAQAAGVPKQDDPGWHAGSRIALGNADVSPLDQAASYATFARNGKAIARHAVSEVKDSTGKVVYSARPKTQQTIPEDVARDVTFALSNVVDEGTGSNVKTIDRPAAGKTGTAANGSGAGNHIVSSWFVAYTKQISTAVMYVADDSGRGNLDTYAKPGDSAFFGGTYPALTWAAYTAAASQGMPKENFDPPAYVNKDKSQQTQKPSEQRTETQTQAPSQSQSGPPPSTRPSTSQPSTSRPPTSRPPTSRPPTSRPPTSRPPTSRPPTSRPPTSQPPSSAPPTSQPPTSQPPTSRPPTSRPPTSQPPTSQPPTSQPPTSQPPTSKPPSSQLPTSQPPSSRKPAGGTGSVRQRAIDPSATRGSG